MRTWSVTDRGLVRSENQDACAVLTPDGYTVAVVCDGMGGTQGGRMASAIAVETFTRELSRSLRPGMSADSWSRRRATPWLSPTMRSGSTGWPIRALSVWGRLWSPPWSGTIWRW